MKGKISLLLIIISFASYARQESIIKIDSGNNNNINIIQSANDAVQKSDLHVKNSDSNKIQLNQKAQNSLQGFIHKDEQRSGFNQWITNTNNVFILLISVLTFTGLAWKGLHLTKKVKSKE